MVKLTHVVCLVGFADKVIEACQRIICLVCRGVANMLCLYIAVGAPTGLSPAPILDYARCTWIIFVMTYCCPCSCGSDSKYEGSCMLKRDAETMPDLLRPYLDRVELVAPVAMQTADWSEANSRPAEEFVEALRNQGLFRMLVPESLGGPGFNS